MTTKIYIPTETETDAAVAALVTRQPRETARFARAAAYVLAGAVGHDGAGWTVTSQDKYRAGKQYRVSSTACECYDHTHSNGACCKHIDALSIFGRCLAARLDATLRPLQTRCAQLTAAGMSDEEAIAALDDGCDPVLGDDVIFFIPGQEINRTHAFDRVSGEHICTAQQQPSGAWRPATASDTLAWAQWLGAQQGTAEATDATVEPVTPVTGLAAVLRNAPGAVTLRADVLYGGTRRYWLEGYRYAGQSWARAELPEGRAEFTEAEWDAALKAAGFEMLQRPVKQPGHAYHYILTRADGATDGTRYALHHVAADTLEREQQTATFAAISAATGDGLVDAPMPHVGASRAFRGERVAA